MRYLAEYFDGSTARQWPVLVEILPDGLGIFAADDGREYARWQFNEIKYLHNEAGHRPGFENTNTQARLRMDDTTIQDALRKAHPNIFKRTLNRQNRNRLILLGGGAVIATTLMVFVFTPALTNLMAASIPVERERQIGQELVTEFIEGVGGFFGASGFCVNEPGILALDGMYASLTNEREMIYDIDLYVIDSDMINAFALPGGQIVLMQGLIDSAQSPEEVAGVLAHEIGHVENRDPMRGFLSAIGRGTMISIVIGDVSGGIFIAGAAEALINANYSQSVEDHADLFALNLMDERGMSSEGFASFFELLHSKYGEVDGLWSHFSSHPQLLDRAENARAFDNHIGQSLPDFNARDWERLQNICQDIESVEPDALQIRIRNWIDEAKRSGEAAENVIPESENPS